MTFKINIGTKSGKTFKLEADAPKLIDKNLHDKINGKDISPDLDGYEFEITGASDKSGFTAIKEVEGIGLKKVLLSYEKGMKKRPRKEGKKKLSDKTPKGLRLRKTVRGKTISDLIVQINLKIIKDGSKKLEEIFPDQTESKIKENRKTKREQSRQETQKPTEEKVEDVSQENNSEQEAPKEESKAEENKE